MKKVILAMIFSVSLIAIASASVTIGTIISASTSYPLVCHDVPCIYAATSTIQAGRINMRPTIASGGGAIPVTITDTGITGYAFGDEIGWINFAPTIAPSSTSAYTTVKVDPSTGVVSGFAYASVGSWINFAPTTATGNPTVGVSIDSNGKWNGWAWVSGAYGGWLHFDCVTSSSLCMETDWRKLANRAGSGSGGSGGSGGGGGGGIVITLPNTNNTTTSDGIILNPKNVKPKQPTIPDIPDRSTHNIEWLNSHTPSKINIDIPDIKTKQISEPTIEDTKINSIDKDTEYGVVNIFTMSIEPYSQMKPCNFCLVLTRDKVVAINTNKVYNVPILKIAAVPKSVEIRVPISKTMSVDLVSATLVMMSVIGLWRMILIRAVSIYLKI